MKDSAKQKLDSRTVSEIEQDRRDSELRCAVNLAELGYEFCRAGKSMIELRAEIVKRQDEFYGRE